MAKLVTAEDVERARREGASDVEIHDTVLIAVSFWMDNRYVDGLDSWQPRDAGMYAQMDQPLAEHGYRKTGARTMRISYCPESEAMPPLAPRRDRAESCAMHSLITLRLHRRIE